MSSFLVDSVRYCDAIRLLRDVVFPIYDSSASNTCRPTQPPADLRGYEIRRPNLFISLKNASSIRLARQSEHTIKCLWVYC